MKSKTETKIFLIILAIFTILFIGLSIFAFMKKEVFAPGEPRPEFKDGIWIDPTIKEIDDYHRALEDLNPYYTWLDNAWIFLSVLSIILLISCASLVSADEEFVDEEFAGSENLS